MKNMGNSRLLTVGLFGAFERHNFGDWLLGWTAERRLGPQRSVAWLYDFPRLGPGVNADCARYVPLAEHLHSDPEAPIIHVGGETLACDSYSAAFYSDNLPPDEPRPAFYILDDSCLPPDTPRYFFGVGGQALGLIPERSQHAITVALTRARWLSVRDSVSKRNLAALGLHARLHPDPVHALPSLVPRLREHPPSNSLVFQASERVLLSEMEMIISSLRRLVPVFESTSLVVAGIAPGHDSFSSLLFLLKALIEAGLKNVRVMVELDPFAIARLVASARLVVSTSLHMRVLAMAFGISRVSFGSEKTENYVNDWDIESLYASSAEELVVVSERALAISRAAMKQHGDTLARQVDEAWLAMMTEGHGL